MHRQTDAVAGAVHEILSQTGLRQYVAGGGVDRLGAHTGTNGRHRGGLCPLQHRVLTGHLGVRLAEAVGAGAVGVVSGLDRASDVDDDDIAGLQLPLGAFVMRVRAVWSGADDDESGLRMSLGDNGVGDIRGHLGLGAPGHQELRHLGVHPINSGTGGAQRLDFVGVLDHSQCGQHAGGQHRHHAEHLGQWQQVQCGHGVSDRTSRRRTAQCLGHQPVGILAVHPVAHRQAQIGDGGLP